MIFKIKKLILILNISIISLLISSTLAIAQSDFEKELNFEKQLEEKISEGLSQFLAPDDYVILVDLQRFTEKRHTLPGLKDDLTTLDTPLPGLALKPKREVKDLPYFKTEALPLFGASRDLDSFAKFITLYLNKKVPPDGLELIKKVINKIARINSGKGDQIVIKEMDIAGISGTKKASPLSDFLTPTKLLIAGIVVALILFTVLLLIILLKGKKSKKEVVVTKEISAQPVTAAATAGAPATGATPQTTAGTVPEKGTKEAISSLNKELVKQDVINLAFSKPEIVAKVLNDWVKEENGLRQAAALVKSFGLETTLNLFSEIESNSKSKIFSYYNTVNNWNPTEEAEALDRLKNAVIAKKFQMVAQSEGGEEHFSFIKKLSDYQLYYLIKDEDLPVIALLLTHLPPERAARLMSQLPPKHKSSIAVEIGNINYVNVDIINAVTKRLAEKSLMIPKFEFYPGSGVNCLVSILDNLDTGNEKHILSSVKQFDANLANKLKKAYFVFDDIIHLNADALKTIIKEIPKAVLATALVGVDETLSKKILGLLPERKAEMLSFDIEKQKNTATAEIEKAQKFLVSKVREMIRAGELDIEKATAAPKPKPTVKPQPQAGQQRPPQQQKPQPTQAAKGETTKNETGVKRDVTQKPKTP